jgi:hypothetical protein
MMIAFSPTRCTVIDSIFFQICRGKPQNPGFDPFVGSAKIAVAISQAKEQREALLLRHRNSSQLQSKGILDRRVEEVTHDMLWQME